MQGIVEESAERKTDRISALYTRAGGWRNDLMGRTL